MARRPKSEALSALREAMRDLHSVGAIDDRRMRDVEEATTAASNDAAVMTFQVYKDKKSEWRWRLKAGNGQIIATSGEGYKLRKACLAAIELVRRAATADIAA